MFAIDTMAEGFAGSIVAKRAERSAEQTLKRIGGEDVEINVRICFVNGKSSRTVWVSDFLRMYGVFWNQSTGQLEADSFSNVVTLDDLFLHIQDIWECGPIMIKEK